MKKLVLAAYLISTSIYAQQNPDKLIKLSASCSSEERVLSLIKKFEEVPMLRMESERELGDGKTVEFITIMFVNPNTLSYTIVERFTKDIYCITGTGKNVTPMLEGATKEKQNDQMSPRKNLRNN